MDKPQEFSVKPQTTRSSFDSIFPWPTVLYVLGYLIYNFTVEYRSWGGEAIVDSTAQSKFDEICDSKTLLYWIFFSLAAMSILWVFFKFGYVHYKVIEQSTMSSHIGWFFSLMWLAIMEAAKATIGVVLVALLIPSSWMLCIPILAHYQCTISLSLAVVLAIICCIVKSVEQPILHYKVRYCSLDVLSQQNLSDSDDNDEDEVELTSQNQKLDDSAPRVV